MLACTTTATQDMVRIGDLVLSPPNPEYALPSANISFSVLPSGLCDQIIKTFRLERLKDVSQLGLLLLCGERLPHTRFEHSMCVMAIATCIGVNIGLNAQQLKTLRIAALVHDGMTPALSDSLILANFALLSEDVNFSKILDDTEWRTFSQKFGVSKKMLCTIVGGNGVLGSILKIADRIAYTALDFECCKGIFARNAFQPGIKEILSETAQYPQFCDAWECVRVSQYGQTYFEDTERLCTFLRIRALMTREVYKNPENRRAECLFSTALPHVFSTEALKAMARASDIEVLANTARLFDISAADMLAAFSSVGSLCFHGETDARCFIQTVRRGGGLAYQATPPPQAKASTGFLVPNEKTIAPLSETRPKACAHIAEILTRGPGTWTRFLIATNPANNSIIEKLRTLAPFAA